MNRKLFLFSSMVAFTGQLFIGCTSKNSQPNTLTDEEKNEGWELLFDGKSLEKWHPYNGNSEKTAWVIKNDAIYCDPGSDAQKFDLTTNKNYENYDFKFEWTLEKEGNSGVFIDVQEIPSINSTWQSGPEYQLLEDSHPDFQKPIKRAGCLYTFLPQENFVNTRSKGEWNESRITQQNGKVTFYLNNKVTASMDFNSEKWKNMVKQSHFKEFVEFGKHKSGKIAFQDWSRGVSLRNIKIKQL